MSYGLRIWNSSGGLELDITDRITRFFATYSYSIPGFGSVTVSIPVQYRWHLVFLLDDWGAASED